MTMQVIQNTSAQTHDPGVPSKILVTKKKITQGELILRGTIELVHRFDLEHLH